MMDLVNVSNEVLTFLENSNAVFLFEDGKKGFYINNILHTESNVEGVFIKHYL